MKNGIKLRKTIHKRADRQNVADIPRMARHGVNEIFKVAITDV